MKIIIIVIILLIISANIGLVIGYEIGRASVPSVYENVQGIRVLQHLLKQETDMYGNPYYAGEVDGILGRLSLDGYRRYDRDNIGFVKDKLK